MSLYLSVSLYVMKSKAKQAAMPFVFDNKTFIVQYELNFHVIPSVWRNKAPCLSLYVCFHNVFLSSV
jgi:hypothetical protein